jgi:hypothetical protein
MGIGYCKALLNWENETDKPETCIDPGLNPRSQHSNGPIPILL